MKVLVAGYSKTGTKTMNAALTLLGFKVYDYEHNFYYLGDQWTKILTKGGTKEDFYEMYKDVDASMDIPACLFWKEILDAFPDMKIIFMRRKSEEEWIKSLARQCKNIGDNYQLKVLSFFSPTAYRFQKYSHHVGRVAFCCPPLPFYEIFQRWSPTVALKKYRDHNQAILALAPKDQMIEFNLRDGWEPLCEFLGKDIPDVPFPHKNQRGTVLDDLLANSPVFLGMKKEMKFVGAFLVIIIAAVLYYFLSWF